MKRTLTRRGRAGILDLLTRRCGERLLQRGLIEQFHHRRAEAHAIRILLRRVGTRTTLEKIIARKQKNVVLQTSLPYTSQPAKAYR